MSSREEARKIRVDLRLFFSPHRKRFADARSRTGVASTLFPPFFSSFLTKKKAVQLSEWNKWKNVELRGTGGMFRSLDGNAHHRHILHIGCITFSMWHILNGLLERPGIGIWLEGNPASRYPFWIAGSIERDVVGWFLHSILEEWWWSFLINEHQFKLLLLSLQRRQVSRGGSRLRQCI